MLKLVLTFFLFFMMPQWCQAQQKKSKEDITANKLIHEISDSMDIYRVLKKQLLKGDNLHYLETNANADDLNAVIMVTDTLLASNGYKKSSNMNFKQKIKNIFGFTDEQCKKDILSFYIGGYANSNCITVHEGDKYHFGYQEQVFSISFKHQLVTTLFSIPQLIDYKTKYPEFKELEQNLPHKIKLNNGSAEDFNKWQDLTGLDSLRQQNTQFLIAFNSYFFNNNRAYVPYLLLKYPELIEALVQDYGYTKEPSFNTFILNKYANKAMNFSDTNYDSYLKMFGESIFKHDCKKHLIVSKDLLSCITQQTDSLSTSKMMSALFYFAVESIESGWSLPQKRKIKAYAASIFDEYFFDRVYTNKEPGLVGHIYIPIMGMTLKYDKEAEAEYIKNNYYGLTNLKEIIAKTKQEWLDDFQYKQPFYPKP